MTTLILGLLLFGALVLILWIWGVKTSVAWLIRFLRQSERAGWPRALAGAVLAATIPTAVVKGVSSFGRFPAKARQAEAKTALEHVHTLQKVYRADNGRYWGPAAGERPYRLTSQDTAAFGGDVQSTACQVDNPLGFHLASCRSRYALVLTQADEASFRALAREVGSGPADRRAFPGCEAPLDEWAVDESGPPRAIFDASTACGPD